MRPSNCVKIEFFKPIISNVASLTCDSITIVASLDYSQAYSCTNSDHHCLSPLLYKGTVVLWLETS